MMDNQKKYILGTNHLVDYCIEHLDAEPIGGVDTRPPFPCLTGVCNTSSSYEIDQELYPNVVAAGIDTWHLNIGVSEYRDIDVFEMLSLAKNEAVSAGYKGNKGMPIQLFGEEFMVLPRGSVGGYGYLLQNGDLELQIMPDARGGHPSPEIRTIFRSLFLWREGEVSAYNKVIRFLNNLACIEYCRVSRADLCVDIAMPLPEIDMKTQVITRLRNKGGYFGGDYQKGPRQTGYQIGKGDIAVRFYDKLYEVQQKGKEHIIPVWELNGYDGVSPVSRLELQLRRNGLRRFDRKMDVPTFLDCRSDIWAYYTNDYLRIIQPDTATRRERAIETPYWKAYKDCGGLFGERHGVLPYRQQNPNWRRLLKQANGCQSTAWAMLATDVGDTEATRIIEKEFGAELSEKVIELGIERKARYGHMN